MQEGKAEELIITNLSYFSMSIVSNNGSGLDQQVIFVIIYNFEMIYESVQRVINLCLTVYEN